MFNESTYLKSILKLLKAAWGLTIVIIKNVINYII